MNEHQKDATPPETQKDLSKLSFDELIDLLSKETTEYTSKLKSGATEEMLSMSQTEIEKIQSELFSRKLFPIE